MTDVWYVIQNIFMFISVFIVPGLAVLFLAWMSGAFEKSKEIDSEESTPRFRSERFGDEKKQFPGWSKWERVWLSDFAGSYRRDRFTRDSSGKVHHYVQYFAKPVDQPGPGSDMTTTDLARGWFESMEKMAEHLNCEIFPE